MTKEEKFYKALQDVFIGAKIEGQGGFVNLMKIKSNYYQKIEELLRKDIEDALKKYPSFREELFDKLYDFFHRYFSESGSIYFNSTPFYNNIYEKVYTDDRDVILFWKTQMLYYVKTDRIFRSMPVEIPLNPPLTKEETSVLKFYFDATTIENKKANEKRDLIYELKEVKEDKTIVFNVYYSEQGKVTKADDILKELKKKNITIDEETLERAFRIFEKQSEVDFFINKNAKAFLQEQFKLWSYQYFWEGAKEWEADRVNQLQILKNIAFKIIDFISQFEDEIVKIWNKPKFVKNSNYVITLDRLSDDIIEKIINHSNLETQIEEWKQLGIVDEDFEIEDIFEQVDSKESDEDVLNLFSKDELQKEGLISNGYHLPYNPKLVERARELRKNMTEAEKKIWYGFLKNFKYRVLRQRPIHHFIVDFYCPALKLVIEIDGEQHYTEEGKAYDEERRKILERYGLREIRFRNKEVMNEFDRVCKEIEEIPPTSALHKENDIPPTSALHKGGIKGGIKKESLHLPIDTKYFKDLELEILSQFDDLDKSLDGWLIKSENYQALNTILPKFKEKVQTIYIDPPFNTGEDFAYIDRFQDSTWLSLMNDRISISRYFLKNTGAIFVHLDHNAEHFGRILLDINFKNGFINNLAWSYRTGGASKKISLPYKHDSILFFAKNIERFTYKPIYERQYLEKPFMGAKQDEEGQYYTDTLLRDVIEGVVKDFSNNKVFNTRPVLNLSNEFYGFKTQKPEGLLYLLLYITSQSDNEIFLDFFAGSGTSLAVAQKLNKKWIGIEMGEHIDDFYIDEIELNNTEKNKKDLHKKFVVLNYEENCSKIKAIVKKIGILGRLKQVLAAKGRNEPCGISEDIDYQGGGFFKYYELEQYEETLANTVYENHDFMIVGNKTPYEQYIFLKDEKMLKALEIDYENKKVKVDLNKLSPNIDIAETLSNLTGKWIKKIRENEVEFEDGTIINTKDLDYKLIKPLIWWE